jgi:amidophosphoribosyltransferase
MMTRGEFVAKNRTVEQIRKVIGADALVYQTYQGLVEAVAGPQPRTRNSQPATRQFCTACFNGEYPTGVTRRYLAQMERERRRWTE